MCYYCEIGKAELKLFLFQSVPFPKAKRFEEQQYSEEQYRILKELNLILK